MAKRRHIVAVDWDDTLVEGRWPEMGDWLPGAVEALKRFHSEGYRVLVFSVRLSPFWQNGTSRTEEEVRQSVQEVRDKLDSAGLQYVGIWQRPGKPPYSVLIDDKAERYHGTTRAWNRLTEKVILRLGAQRPTHVDTPEWGREGVAVVE